MQDSNIGSLQEKHAELEAMLEDETSRPLPDQSVITQIKRQKLVIKDTMAALATA